MRTYQKTMKIRFFLMFILTSLAFTVLLGKIIKIQAYENDKYRKMAEGQHVGEIQISALRGAIYDRNGSVLAFSVARPSVAINPTLVKNPGRTAFYLSLALGIDKKEIMRRIQVPTTFAWVARKIDEKTANQIERLKLPGIFILNESSGKRFHPKRRIASHVVGYTGVDDQGLEGVEASYDEILKGKPGDLKAEMDQRGRMLPGGQYTHKPTVPGKDIYLTIDESIQYIVEKELARTVKEFNADGGTIIVYEPRTGDILALANYPDYLPSRGIWTPKRIVRNKAVCDNYEPGSTFKVILAAAALDSGKVTSKDQFYCGQSIAVGGYNLRNANDGIISPSGTETIDGVITYSFNVGAAAIGLRIGRKTLYKYVDGLGFGKLSHIDLPGEREGMVIPEKYWKPINLATISYGQGIAVTPVQMVQAYGAIVNDGVKMKPRVVRKIMDTRTGAARVIKPKILGKPLKAKTSYEILEILHNVCENGTGKAARIKGYKVGGKTGTANVVKNGVYVTDNYIASFVGVVPVEDPRLVILIKIDRPRGIIWGGCVAAPAFNKIGSQILWRLGIQPDLETDAAELVPPEPLKEKEKGGEE